MSWSKVDCFGLLDRFQERMEQEPFKFNQLDSGYNDYMRAVWLQSERDELAYNLRSLFFQVAQWLGYYPQPIWKEITIPLDQYKFYTDSEYFVPESAYLNAFGSRGTELLQAGLTYTTVDETSPYPNFATFELTTTEITDGQLMLFVTSTDAFGNTADDRFRIIPSTQYYDGTKYVIKVPYARLIKPELQLIEFVNSDPQNRKTYSPTDTSNFIQSVDAYRVYNDDTTKAEVIGYPYNFSGTTVQTKTVDAIIMDSEEAKFRLVENDTYPTFMATHVKIYANIGKPLTDEGFMDQVIEEMIIRKAKVDMALNARLAEAKISAMWDGDELLSYAKGNENSGLVGVGFRPNPIGSRNVDIEMFKKFLPIANWRGKLTDSRFWIR